MYYYWPRVSNSFCFAIQPAVFEMQAVWDKCIESSQNDLEPYRVEYTLYMCYRYPWVPYFILFLFTTRRFGLTCHFETSVANHPKMTLNPTMSNIPYICDITIHESQISVRFTHHPAVFETQAILRQVLRMTPTWPWTLQGQMYPHIFVASIHDSQISLSFVLWPAVFEIEVILRPVYRMTQMTLNPTRSNVPHIYDHFLRFSHFSHLRYMASRFRVTGHFEKSAPNDPQWP